MKEIFLDIFKAAFLFALSVFVVFFPPVRLIFTILGIIGMIIALLLLFTTVILEALKDE